MSNTQHFNADEPIKKLDDDSLGRRNFSENLAKAIIRYSGKESLVIGLYGSWGSGKTSVINMMTDALEREDKDNQPIIIRFEPWYFSGQDQLLEQFFKHLANQVIGYFKKANKNLQRTAKIIGGSLTRLGSALKPAKYVTPYFGLSAEGTEVILSNIQEVGNTLSGNKKDQKFDPINEKKELIKEITKLNKKLLIIIDDIDRLTKEEMRQVFQLVKALANFPNTIYLLSFDEKVIAEALKDVQAGDGSQFLEKIIQVPFTIPDISQTTLDKYLITQIEAIIEKSLDYFEYSDYWKRLFSYQQFRRYFENIREINRFLNIFKLEYDLIGKEVNPVDLIVITAIKSQDHKLYSFIEQNKEIFCRSFEEDHKLKRIELRDEEKYNEYLREKYLSMKPQFRKNEIVESILSGIFPNFKKLVNKSLMLSSFPENDWQNLQKWRRIACHQYFDNFFLLSLQDNQISYDEIQRIIQNQHYPESFFNDISFYIPEKADQIFNELRLRIDQIQRNNIKPLIKVLSPLGDSLPNRFQPEEFYYFITDLVKAYDSDILRLFKEIFNEDMEGLYLPCVLYREYVDLLGFEDQQGNRNEEKINKSRYAKDFKEVKNFIDKRLSDWADNGDLQKHPNLLSALYTWKKINAEATINYTNKLLETQGGIVDFLTGGLSWSISYSAYVSTFTTNLFISTDYIDTFVTDQERFINKIKDIKNNLTLFNSLPENSRIAIEVFLNQFNCDVNQQ